MKGRLGKRAEEVLALLEKKYGRITGFLKSKDAWQLLVATQLSAQCTDERVNQITPALFAKYKTAKDFAECDLMELQKLVYSSGFYRQKARNIRNAARVVVERFKGKVPRTMDELLELPGVGRKTANVVLAQAYGIEAGITVDTHVGRLARRLGFTKEVNPDKVERDLVKVFPEGRWEELDLLLIQHGRDTCTSRKAFCSRCVLSGACPRVGVEKSR
ncbi:MAG TPA: endonuclease III [archaeon]|nr:endonuclease III [archaeon]HLD81253.1 endonuclease III [archaeon]